MVGHQLIPINDQKRRTRAVLLPRGGAWCPGHPCLQFGSADSCGSARNLVAHACQSDRPILARLRAGSTTAPAARSATPAWARWGWRTIGRREVERPVGTERLSVCRIVLVRPAEGDEGAIVFATSRACEQRSARHTLWAYNSAVVRGHHDRSSGASAEPDCGHNHEGYGHAHAPRRGRHRTPKREQREPFLLVGEGLEVPTWTRHHHSRSSSRSRASCQPARSARRASRSPRRRLC